MVENEPAKKTVTTAGRGEGKRWTGGRKAELVMRVLKGEDARAVAQSANIPAGDLGKWRDAFVSAGTVALRGAGNGAGGGHRKCEKRIRDLESRLGSMLVARELKRERR